MLVTTALAGVVTASCAVVAIAVLLYGPRSYDSRTRATVPLLEREQAFLQKHVKDGKEETGFMLRPRSGNRSVRVFYRCWLPKHKSVGEATSQPKAVVVMLSGVNSHSARNAAYAAPLLARGIAVVGVDYEGFGRSDGRHGYFESVEHLVGDVGELLRRTCEKFAGRKVFLQGSSMGGLLVILTLLKYPSLVDGAIILCPAIAIDPRSIPSPPVIAIGKVIRLIAPKLALVEGNRGKNCAPEVAAVVEAEKRADPLFYNGRLRIGTGLAIQDASRSVQGQFHRISTPYLLQHGTGDKVCSVAGSELFHQATSSVDKQMRAYPDGAHDLASERPHIRDAVTRDYVEWIEARTEIRK